MSASACSVWPRVTLMCSRVAKSSRTWNRISQLSTSLGIWAAVSCTALEYGLAAWLSAETSLSSWPVEIRSLPTVAAAPSWTGAQPAISPPKAAATTAALTAVAVLIRVRRTTMSLLTPNCPIPGSSLGRLTEHSVDELGTPGEHVPVPQRLAADGGWRRCGHGPAPCRAGRGRGPGRTGYRLRHRHQHRTHCRLEQCPGVQPLHPDLPGIRKLYRGEPDVVALERDVGQAGPARPGPQPCDLQQVEHGFRELAIPVGQLVSDRTDVAVGVDRRDLRIGLQPQPLAGQVVVRNVRVDRQLDPDLRPVGRAVPLELVDRLADHPDVQVEADTGDLAGLLAAEQVARAADLQVLEGHVHAGPHLGVLGHGREPLVRG